MSSLKLPALPIPLLRKKAPTIALALSGGSAKGLVHIGVLKVLEKNKIPINAIAGTSMGSLIGGLYAAGKLWDFEKACLKLSKKEITNLFIEMPQSSGFVGGKKIKEFLSRFIKNVKIEDLNIKYAAVAVNLRTGMEVVLDKGSLLKAIRASTAIPGFFTPVKYDDMLLVDGGVVNPVPISVAKTLGDKVIVSNVYSHHVSLTGEYPANLFKIVLDSISVMERKIIELSQLIDKADISIEPPVGLTTVHYSEIRKAIRIGEKAATEALPQIKKMLRM